jgi:hypothetical protein
VRFSVFHRILLGIWRLTRALWCAQAPLSAGQSIESSVKDKLRTLYGEELARMVAQSVGCLAFAPVPGFVSCGSLVAGLTAPILESCLTLAAWILWRRMASVHRCECW